MIKVDTEMPLIRSQRQNLCGIILSHLMDNGIKIGRSECSEISKQVEKFFIKETASTFYDEENKTGLLYSKANYIQRVQRAETSTHRGSISQASKRQKLDESQSEVAGEIMITQEAKNADEFVIANSSSSFEVMIAMWKMSYPVRREKSLTSIDPEEIFNSYKVLEYSYGYHLVNFLSSSI